MQRVLNRILSKLKDSCILFYLSGKISVFGNIENIFQKLHIGHFLPIDEGNITKGQRSKVLFESIVILGHEKHQDHNRKLRLKYGFYPKLGLTHPGQCLQTVQVQRLFLAGYVAR